MPVALNVLPPENFDASPPAPTFPSVDLTVELDVTLAIESLNAPLACPSCRAPVVGVPAVVVPEDAVDEPGRVVGGDTLVCDCVRMDAGGVERAAEGGLDPKETGGAPPCEDEEEVCAAAASVLGRCCGRDSKYSSSRAKKACLSPLLAMTRRNGETHPAS